MSHRVHLEGGRESGGWRSIGIGYSWEPTTTVVFGGKEEAEEKEEEEEKRGCQPVSHGPGKKGTVEGGGEGRKGRTLFVSIVRAGVFDLLQQAKVQFVSRPARNTLLQAYIYICFAWQV